MNNKRKKLQVSAIENGTVIDHIPAQKVFQVVRILGLETSMSQVTVGINLESKKYGKKGIVKVSGRFFAESEVNKIALAAPSASLIEIRDFEVVKKGDVSIPDEVTGIVKCFNPKCITNVEDVMPKFDIIDKKDLKLHCYYCEKITKEENIEFLL